jgi:predicted TIM-barrel fold metal-dependent hydrolase
MTASGAVLEPDVVLGQDAPQAGRTLDIHVHLFGKGDNGSNCRLLQGTAEGPLFECLSGKLRLRERAKTMDEAYVLALAEHVQQSNLDKVVVLAQDAVYDDGGRADWGKTAFYVPNDYLFEVVSRYPQRMIPCVSINPQRADAIDEMERCVAKGARVLKIHPPTQGVDLADERKYAPFFRRCAELRVVVMVHTGHEHSAPVVDIGLANPRKLVVALDHGCTVIACHCGTGRPSDRPDMLPDFLEMLRQHKNLWGDTSVLGGLGRGRDFLRLLAHREARERLLHGSDFPFPATPLAFVDTLGLKAAFGLQTIENSLQQDLALKDALGIGRASAERAYRLICGEAGQS